MWKAVRIGAEVIVFVGILATGVLWAEAPTDVFVEPIYSRDTLTIGWVGDMVPSGDPEYNENVFAEVAGELMKPDLMIGNLEGTFATAERTDKCMYLTSMCHAFRGDLSFAASIRDAGFDFVSLVNNHSYDFGKDGLADTEAILDAAGIPYISPNKQSTSITVKSARGGPASGWKIGILGLSSTEPTKTITDYEFIERNVAELKQTNDIVIVIFHGGAEGSDKTQVPGTTEYMGTENRGDVERVAHVAIDAGADVVLGAGPHVLRKIDTYRGAPIAYSLGNFVGGKRLVMGGNLSLSGIFTATFKQGMPTTYDFTSVLLRGDGTPTIDVSDESKWLLRELGK